MKKVIIVGLVIILFLLILLSLLFGVFSNKSNPTSSSISPIPTRSYSSNTNTTTEKEQTTTSNATKDSTDIVKTQELLKNISSLSKKDFLLLEDLKKSLPYHSDDFDIEFSPLLNKFIVSKKTSQAAEKIKQWALQNGVTNLISRDDLFMVTDKSYEQIQEELELPIQEKKNESVNSKPPSSSNEQAYQANPPSSSTVVISPAAGQNVNEKFDMVSESIKNIFSSFVILPTATPTPAPTSAPGTVTNPSYDSAPSSLNVIFAEVAQKVGVPARIIEGVMRIEYPSTFDLSAEEITRCSTPGNTIIGCAPNVCSATGPMQMTIGTDGNGSSSCSSCCWNGNCLSNCPNAWLSYGGSVNTYGGYSHTSNPCNLRDNVYAAAAKLKSDSGASNATSWTQDEVYKAGKRYYGNCTATYERLGNRNYCEYLWWYYTNSEGSGGSGTSTESNSYKGYVYYSQCGDPYGDLALPGGCTLCKAGCGATTTSMILSSKIDSSYTPEKLIDLYEQNGYQLNCSGSYYMDAKNIIEKSGVQTSDLIFYYPSSVPGSEIIEDVKSYTQAGWTIFALANFGCTAGSCGHFFWIVDVDDQNNILAFDPFYGRYEIPYNENARSPQYRIGFGVK